MHYRPMVITLFTDAGYCPLTGCGSWAAWAKADGKTMRKGGVLKGTIKSSGIAELMALCNGMFCAINTFLPPEGSLVVVQVDAMLVIDAMTGRFTRKKTQKRYEPYRKTIAGLLAPNRIDVDYRHVAGHEGNKTRRHAVNTWCDTQCTKFLAMARWELKAKLTQEFEELRAAEAVAEAEITAKVQADTEARVGF